MFVVELEQAPYKIDQWNALSDVCENLVVIYTVAEPNVAKSEHAFSIFPESRFDFIPAPRGLLRPLRAFLTFRRLYTSRGLPREPVLVQGYSSVATFLACLYCGARGLPLFLHTDNLQSSVNPSSVGLLSATRRLLGKLARLILSLFTNVVVVCGEAALEGLKGSEFRRACGLNFPYVVSRSRLQLAAGPEQPTRKDNGRFHIMFSGRLIERKGCHTLLQALRLLDNPRIYLTVEGAGEMRQSLELLAKDLRHGSVRFIGPQDFPDHYTLMKSVDLVCVPSLYDGWGIVVDEAQQLSVLVVASDRVSSAVDRISPGENGFLFRAGDAGHLAEIIDTCINMPRKQRQDIGLQAGFDSLKHSPETYAEHFVEEVSRAGYGL